MPLFSDTRLSMLHNAISTRAHRFLNFNPMAVSSDDIIELFVKPEHIAPLKEVQDLVGDVGSSWMSYDHTTHDNQRLRFNIQFSRPQPIIMPQYAFKGLRDGANATVVEKFRAMLDERYRLGVLFGDALHALRWLSENCTDVRGARALFPALTILLNDIASDATHGAAKLARKLDDNKTVRSLPSIPRQVMRHLQEVTDLLTATQLLPSDAVAPATPANFSSIHYSSASISREGMFGTQTSYFI